MSSISPKSDPRLYVFLRSDLESMTVGKAAAQVSHAASQLAWQFRSKTVPEPFLELYRQWEVSAVEEAAEFGKIGLNGLSNCAGFGTAIVKDGGSELFDDPDNIVLPEFVMRTWYGAIRDPSYPLKDGKRVHHLDLVTCFWIFCDPNSDPDLKDWLAQFDLYNGNHD